MAKINGKKKEPTLKATHKTDSGCGGTVNVAILFHGSMFAKVKVISPNNPDWHGHEFTTALTKLIYIYSNNYGLYFMRQLAF